MFEFPDPVSPSGAISFDYVDTDFRINNQLEYIIWLKNVINYYHGVLVELNFVICSDEYLHKINIAYLNHDTLTDVITFPYDEAPKVHAETYISIERIYENASIFNVNKTHELRRILAHSLLHLFGYEDGTSSQKEEMRKLELHAISLY